MSGADASFSLLPWDSAFFGMGVARLDEVGSAARLTETLQRARGSGVQLVYAQSRPDDLQTLAVLRAAGGVFVDAKRTYQRGIANEPVPNATSISLATATPCERRQLRSLAWQSAAFSRFKLDARLPRGAWRRMYSIWIAKSLSREIASDVLVEQVGNRIVGMVTVTHEQSPAKIGLMAVDASWQGRGLGRRLLAAAFGKCRQADCTHILVVTQGHNEAACRAYEAAGFTPMDEQHLFHIWL